MSLKWPFKDHKLNLHGSALLWGQIFMFLISVNAVVAAIIDYGFVLDDTESMVINIIYNVAWWVFFIAYIFRLFFDWEAITSKAVFMTVISGLMLLFTAMTRLWDVESSDSLFSLLWNILGSKLFFVLVVLFFSVLEISKGVVSFINKKTNPALLMTVCFAIVIILGTILLLLPRSTLEHIRLAVTDALFVSTSAVCVTGLSTVDVAQTFTLEGQIVIMLLIQVGGLGVMTITSFFALFFMGGAGLYNQFALRDMIGSDTFSSLISTLLYILGFTFAIELLGALFIWMSIHSTLGMTLHEELFFSLFHSVSAFCNAGFSTLTGNLGNAAVMTGHNSFYLIISFLVILGGIGFPILVNYKRLFAYTMRKLWVTLFKEDEDIPRYKHIVNLNSKIVLSTTLILLVGGTVAIAVVEWNEAFAHMPLSDKLVHSFFNAVVPRTAGFNSVDLTEFSILTVLLYMVLMWIGGASQSSAGGIKVNTIAVAFVNLVSVIKGREELHIFGREIAPASVRRAYATVLGSLIAIIIAFVLLVVMEPELSPKALLFETISAYSTVGSSLNLTPLLGNDSKIVVTMVMFIGRVGFISVMMGFVQGAGASKYALPKDDVIIN